MAGTLNLPTLYIGSSYNDYSIQWLQPDEVTPVNLTGCSVEIQVRTKLDDVSPLYTFSTGNGKLILTEALGKWSFNITDEDTATYTPGITAYIYGCRIFMADGSIIPFCKGKWSFSSFPAR
jgi:hypothetical protein